MQCRSCQSEVSDTAKFCAQCGARQIRACDECGHEVRPDARFCPECGTRLLGPRRLSEPKPAPIRQDPLAEDRPRPMDRGARDADRRQITVMFCDLVGSTALSGQLDPEDLRELVRAYQETCAEVIRRFDGHIAQYLGDGLLVYFGFPMAHEDSAHRAVRAGLGILVSLGQLNRRLERQREVQLGVRIGIHTGRVVVGEMGGGGRYEQLALGETPNVAARVQGLAEPDTVVISGMTLRLVRGHFTCRDLGCHAVKGVAEPLPVFRVLRESGFESRADLTEVEGSIPMVGREQEKSLLMRRWQKAQAGAGQVVVLSGEAGMGKSRLIQALEQDVASEGAIVMQFLCLPYYRQSALFPVIHHFRQALHLAPEEAAETKLEKLKALVESRSASGEEQVPFLASLLSIEIPEGRYPGASLSPRMQSQRTQEILRDYLIGAAEKAAVILVFEDLQYADPSTLELLSQLLRLTPTTRCLTVVTSRPEFRPPWDDRSRWTQLTLDRLSQAKVEELAQAVAGGKSLPAEVIRQLVSKTDGIPVFVEELTKMILESGLLVAAEDRYELSAPLPPLAIPATLQDSLMARLDGLPSAGNLAQLAATLGREFSFGLLAAVSSLDELSLRKGLAELLEAELIYQRGLPPRARYSFKHAMIQETAYRSLLRATRERYHQQIAQVLEERFPETAVTEPELLAHHATEAGLPEKAVTYWQLAGETAAKRSANLEAISHLSRGLELLGALDETPERLHQELRLQADLGASMIATRSYAAPEVKRAYIRALELCQQVGESPELFRVQCGLFDFYLGCSELSQARALGEQLLHLADEQMDPSLLMPAHTAMGETTFHSGELETSRGHLEHASAFYDARYHRSQVLLYGRDVGVVSACRFAWCLWLLGFRDQALKEIQDGGDLARQLAHPFSLVVALISTSMFRQFTRDRRAAREAAQEARLISGEQGFALWLAMATILNAWATDDLETTAETIAEMQQGLADFRATGSCLSEPYLLSLLAEVHTRVGRFDDALAALEEALALAEETRQAFWVPELYRLRGELLLKTSTDEGRAEESFLLALDVARRQSAKSLELRAAMSLSQVWHNQGKAGDAQQLLEAVYGWFTEGFESADLRQTKAQMDNPASSALSHGEALRG